MYQRKLMTIIWLPWVEALYHENGNQITPTTFRRSDKSFTLQGKRKHII